MTPLLTIEIWRHVVAFFTDEKVFRHAEHFPAFWSIFGFVACTLIIFLSKWYGHAGIMKREDYYDE